MLIHHFNIPKITQNRLIAAGFRSEEDFIDKNEEEIKACGVGPKGLYDLKTFLKYEFKIKIEKAPKKKVLDNSGDCKKLVEHFLSKDISWPRELRSANDLLKRYPLEFLLKIPPPPKIYSLGYFFQDFGVKYLQDNAPVKLVREEKVEEVVEEVAPKEYTQLDRSKPKGLKDFLGL